MCVHFVGIKFPRTRFTTTHPQAFVVSYYDAISSRQQELPNVNSVELLNSKMTHLWSCFDRQCLGQLTSIQPYDCVQTMLCQHL